MAKKGVHVDHELQCPRKRKKKRLSADESNDEIEALGSNLRKFEIETYKTTVDVARAEIDRRFSKNKELFQDLAMLEPQQFADTKMMLESNKSILSKISRLANVNLETLREELVAFANCYQDITKIKETIRAREGKGSDQNADDFMEEVFSIEEYAEEDINDQAVAAAGKEKEMPITIPCIKMVEPCQLCIPCAFKALHVYNMHVAAYTSLYVAYKCVMTLSCTQVSCERLFSKLKIVKNRLRSTISQPNLESLLIISSEEKSFPVDYDQIIDQFADTSELLQKQLKL